MKKYKTACKRWRNERRLRKLAEQDFIKALYKMQGLYSFIFEHANEAWKEEHNGRCVYCIGDSCKSCFFEQKQLE